MTEKEFEHTIMPLAENVYSYAVNMLGNPDDAADITQDVMAKLWETGKPQSMGAPHDAQPVPRPPETPKADS